ncbi:MAG: hotdog fold thioesterase [Herpetosiphonaceae bacterium]|nr:hotdog fold thioesterase [Herpetosiphonaceae bacterium]
MDEQNLSTIQQGGLITLLGIEFHETTTERIVATMPVTPNHHQPFGFLHGGASMALAETVASVGGFINCPPGRAAFGLEINANHLRPVRSGTLTAVGTPLHRGQTTQVWEIKISDERSRLVCISRCTVAIVVQEPDAPTT